MLALLGKHTSKQVNLSCVALGLRAPEGEVTVRPIPHGPGLPKETAAAAELHPKVVQRAPGSHPRACSCCRWPYAGVASWQFVTKALKPAVSLLCVLLLPRYAKTAAFVLQQATHASCQEQLAWQSLRPCSRATPQQWQKVRQQVAISAGLARSHHSRCCSRWGEQPSHRAGQGQGWLWISWVQASVLLPRVLPAPIHGSDWLSLLGCRGDCLK